MAVVQLNDYQAGVNNNLTSAVNCIDYGRLGLDHSRVEWSSSQFVLKSGSMVECNGNLYTVNADYNLGTGSGILLFNSSTLAFSIGNGAAAYNAAKAGHYVSTTVRALKWYTLGQEVYQRGSKIIKTGANTFDFVPPAGCERVRLEMVAQGGAGGAWSSTSPYVGGGGGSGAWYSGFVAVVPGTVYSIVLSTSTSSTAFGMTFGKGGDGSIGTSGTAGVGSGGSITGGIGGYKTTLAGKSLGILGDAGTAGGTGTSANDYGNGSGAYGSGSNGSFYGNGGGGSGGGGGGSSGVCNGGSGGYGGGGGGGSGTGGAGGAGGAPALVLELL